MDTILIVENEALVREALVDILELAGLPTIEAINGHDAIAAFRAKQDQIGVVLLDMRLPDMGGSDVLSVLETIRPDVNVIVASGEDRQKLIHIFREHSNVSILSKPYDIEMLLSQVRARLVV